MSSPELAEQDDRPRGIPVHDDVVKERNPDYKFMKAAVAVDKNKATLKDWAYLLTHL